MNYADARYEPDRKQYPHRVIVGTETYPPRIAHNWRLVMDTPHVLGDFTWTGWDYLSEVGVGRVQYADETPRFEAPFPWLTAWVGDIDITGRRWCRVGVHAPQVCGPIRTAATGCTSLRAYVPP